MADDSQMMKDLNSLASAHQDGKPVAAGPKKFATGPGSGPMRGRRAAATAAQPIVPPKPRYIPSPPSIASVWAWAIAGLFLLFLAIISLAGFLFPSSWTANAPALSDRLTNLLAGLGFLAVAHSRGLSRTTYEIAVMKDRKDSHGWKIPLMIGQGFLLYSIGIYVLGVALHVWPPVRNLVGMTIFVTLFFGYVVWYLLAYLSNRLPGQAGRITAMAASLLAALSFVSWCGVKSLLPACLFGFFALVCGAASLRVSPVEQLQDRSDKFRGLFIILTILLLLPTALGLLPNGKKQTSLVDLGSVFRELPENVQRTVYSPDGRTLAIVQYRGSKQWSLLLLDRNLPNPALQVPGGTAAFRPVFINKGTALVADFTVNNFRNLYRVDTATGLPTLLTKDGILPMDRDEGTPWSEEAGKMLVTVQKGGDFEILALDPARPDKTESLVKTPRPVRCPSWIEGGKGVVWVGGPPETPTLYAMDLAEKKTRILAQPTVPEEQTILSPEGEKALAEVGKKLNLPLAPKKGKDMARLLWASPSPNDFMVLYAVKSGKITTLSSVLMNGEKAKPVYTTRAEVKHVSWNAQGHEVVFEEILPWGTHFFIGLLSTPLRNVRLLDVNLGTSSTLVMPQLDAYGPAFSPDGVKVAFLGTKNLWFPTWLNKAGVWVAVLR